eukprot:9503329-Pyramimonas_sp.AAC.1
MLWEGSVYGPTAYPCAWCPREHTRWRGTGRATSHSVWEYGGLRSQSPDRPSERVAGSHRGSFVRGKMCDASNQRQREGRGRPVAHESARIPGRWNRTASSF